MVRFSKPVLEQYVKYVLHNPYIPHEPTPRQAIFLMTQGLEALYGGGAGGGKSDGLLMAALMFAQIPNYNAILFRRTFSDLNLPDSLIPRSHEWLAETDAHWNGADYRWTFPSGATLSFGYMASDKDKYRYQSAQFQFIGFDELTQFPADRYLYMFSRLRRLVGTAVPLRARGATNPGGIGHDWVTERFVLDNSRPFIPSLLGDNPYIDQDEYRRSLKELDETERRQLEFGEWVSNPEGKPFRREWWRGQNRFHIGVGMPSVLGRYQSWDTALTDKEGSAFSAMVEVEVMSDFSLRITNIYNDKPIFPELPEVIKGQHDSANHDGLMTGVVIEGQASGKPAIQTLRASIDSAISDHVIEFTPKESKLERAQRAAMWCKRGLVQLPHPGPGAEWLGEFEKQLFNFPDGTAKDMVDAFAQIVIYLENYLITAWHGIDKAKRGPRVDSRVARALRDTG